MYQRAYTHFMQRQHRALAGGNTWLALKMVAAYQCRRKSHGAGGWRLLLQQWQRGEWRRRNRWLSFLCLGQHSV
jgi:hypothetical protein